MATQKKHTI